MATEKKDNPNKSSAGPAVPPREAVPPGISHRDGTNGAHPGTDHTSEQSDQIPAWERVQIARHPERPHTLDYIQQLCTDFVEMHGDRLFGEDASIIGGLACFEGRTVMVMGQQKGRSTKENLQRNFGMPQPEGYRKAQRLMEHAARFGFPILTFIDTPGANPGMQSEERGIGQAIAANIMTMLQLGVPIIATVIGEGGSGGALAIGVGDRVLMLENSIYSAASPESAAAILWRDASQASTAAQTMHITAPDLMQFGVIDEIIKEPDGGAHADTAATIEAVRDMVERHLRDIEQEYALRTVKGRRKLLEARREKYRRIGEYDEAATE